MQGELFSWNAVVSKLLFENLKQSHCGEEFMNTFRISPKPLDLSLFLRTDKESVESNADRKAPAGRKWRSKFQEFSRRLGSETCQLLDKVFLRLGWSTWKYVPSPSFCIYYTFNFACPLVRLGVKPVLIAKKPLVSNLNITLNFIPETVLNFRPTITQVMPFGSVQGHGSLPSGQVD